jgi:hypothetical protein
LSKRRQESKLSGIGKTAWKRLPATDQKTKEGANG